MVGYVAFGSNLGDRRAHLRAGLDGLCRAGVEVVAVSSLWETEPVDAPGTPPFLNLVAEVRSAAEPADLLRVLQDIERLCGRRRGAHHAPRTLDLDLLLLGERTVDGPDLQLPHPRMWQRRFVLEPLAELAPALRNPATGRTVDEERRALGERPCVRRIGRLATAQAQPL